MDSTNAATSTDIQTEGWWFEQTNPQAAHKCTQPPNFEDIANLANMMEERGDSSLTLIKAAVQRDKTLLNRSGLYEQVETSGQRYRARGSPNPQEFQRNPLALCHSVQVPENGTLVTETRCCNWHKVCPQEKVHRAWYLPWINSWTYGFNHW